MQLTPHWESENANNRCTLISAQAGAPGTAGSVPNPFMSDFPSLGSQSTQSNAAAFGLFEQSAANVAANVSGGDGQQQGQIGGDLFSAGGQADLFGGDSAVLRTAEGVAGDAAAEAASSVTLTSGKSTATPPPRPPPPATAMNGTPRPTSPTMSGAAAGKLSAGTSSTTAAAPSKSAFDDLNDSIRMALGGSPSRPAPISQQLPTAAQQAQQPLQQGFGMFDMAANMAATGQPVMPGGPMVGYGIPTQVPAGYGSPAKQPTSGDGNV